MPVSGQRTSIATPAVPACLAVWAAWIAAGCDPPPITFAAALDGAATRDLYTIAADGSGLTRLTATDDLDEYAVRVSPDGRQLAHLIGAELFVRPLAGGEPTRIAAEVGRDGRGLVAPAWSPDGERLLYCYPREPWWVDLGEEVVDESYATTLHFVDADGGNDEPLVPPPIGDRTLTYPSWSADGWIAYLISDDCADCAGGWDYLGLIREDLTDYREVFFDIDFDLTDLMPRRDLDWSPDGSQLLFTGVGVVVTDPSSSDRERLTEDGWTPRWSPDGRRIAYVTDAGIHVMDADGGDAELVFAAEGVTGLDW